MPVLGAVGFDWDYGNLAKCQKHGVAVDDIEAVFKVDVWLGADRNHSLAEARFVAVGPGLGVRPIYVVFTLRQRGARLLVRPLSARYMHRKEIKRYEKEAAEDSEDGNR